MKIVTGPVHERFDNKTGYVKGPTTSAEKEMFGCLPLFCTKVTILGFVKTSAPCSDDFNNNIRDSSTSSVNIIVDDENDDDANWNTDDESEEKESPAIGLSKNVSKLICDKFTQTDGQSLEQQQLNLSPISINLSQQRNHLSSLIDSLCDLVNAMTQWQEQMRDIKHCHHCHS